MFTMSSLYIALIAAESNEIGVSPTDKTINLCT